MAKLFNLAGMSTATTGTGTITLGSAMYGHLTFALAGVANGETITYAIKDGASSEIGRGVYTASGTTLTRTVLKSTNSNSAINLSGSAEVFITPAAEDIIEPPTSSVDSEIVLFSGTTGDVIKRASTTGILKGTSGVLSAATAGTDYVAPSAVREKLAASRTYYVRTDGSNSNDGLANTSGGAFLTIQKACDVVTTLDNGGNDVTINVADGTYAEAVTIKPMVGSGALLISGNTTTPANVVAQSFSLSSTSQGLITVQGFSCGTGSYPVLVSGNAKLTLGVMRWTGTSWTQISAQEGGSIRILGEQFMAAATSPSFFFIAANGRVNVFSTINHTTATAYASGFAYVSVASLLGVEAATFSGSSATGPRHYNQASVISLGGKTLPGNSAGTDANGGQTF